MAASTGGLNEIEMAVRFPHSIKLGAIYCITALMPAFASAKVIRMDGAIGCQSREAYQIFRTFIAKRDIFGYNNALKNGECIGIPFGMDVQVLSGEGSLYYSIVRLPGDTREWWISSSNFSTVIEQEELLAKLEALEKEFQQKTEAPGRAPYQQRVEQPWHRVPGQLPTAQKDEMGTPAALFRETKDSVWAIVAFKGTATTGELQPSAQGSAIAVSSFHLVTNCHVTAGAERLILSQGAEQFDAILLSSDSATDRCVLAAQRALPAHVRGVRRFSELEIGERVFTVGSPRGLQHTLGDGLISGLRSDESGRYIQTSAPISPGSSGGGLFDAAGNLIGITTFMLKESQALNFAIAAEDFWRPD